MVLRQALDHVAIVHHFLLLWYSGAFEVLKSGLWSPRCHQGTPFHFPSITHGQSSPTYILHLRGTLPQEWFRGEKFWSRGKFYRALLMYTDEVSAWSLHDTWPCHRDYDTFCTCVCPSGNIRDSPIHRVWDLSVSMRFSLGAPSCFSRQEAVSLEGRSPLGRPW